MTLRPNVLPVVTALVAVLACSAPSSAQEGLPYTDHRGDPPGPMAALITDLVNAINANEPQRFIEFLDRHATGPFRDQIPMERHLGAYRRLCAETQGIDYYGWRTYDPPRPETEHVFIVRDRLLGGWRAVLVLTSPDEPSKLVGMQLQPARPPEDLEPAPALTLEQAVEELDRAVGQLAAADVFSGTVLVALDGNTVYERAVGEASKRFHAANTIDTLFNLGSMNKMFTAVAIAQLAERGTLALDDPIGNWVDESWLPAEITDKVLIRHCLSHTSGLGSYFNDTYWSSSRGLYRQLDDYKPLVRGETLAFAPGTSWAYSNTGFLLLGVVIEKASGQSYFDYVREHVYRPAGMLRSDSHEMDVPVENLAIGYVPQPTADGRPAWRNNVFLHVIRGGPAGGGFSTVRDLLAFDVALRSGRLVSPAMRDELWKARPDAGSPRYGYGFQVGEGPLGTVVGHGGGFPGLSGQLDMYLDAGYTVAVLSNYDRGAGPVAELAASLLARVE